MGQCVTAHVSAVMVHKDASRMGPVLLSVERLKVTH